MTGQELFHAMSFVDERYVQEAESAKLSSGIPWMKLLSVAACLCILLVGAFALEHIGYKGAEAEAAPEAAPEAAAPEAAPEAAEPEAAPLMPEEAFSESAAEEEGATDELQHVEVARLRVVEIVEGVGFEAVVLADEPMEVDTQVRVIVDPSKVPGADKDAYGGGFLAVEEGDILETTDAAYDPELNVLYVSHVRIVEETP